MIHKLKSAIRWCKTGVRVSLYRLLTGAWKPGHVVLGLMWLGLAAITVFAFLKGCL